MKLNSSSSLRRRFLSRSKWIAALGATVLGASLFTTATAWAGGSAVVSTDDGRGKVSRNQIDFDSGRLRLESSSQPDGLLIVRDGIAYMTAQMGGKPVVLELTTMIRMFGARVQRLADGTDGVREFVSLTDTGRKETLAGITGAVYELIYVDGDGDKRKAEIVLSAEPHVAEFTKAFRSLLAVFQNTAKVASPPGTTKLWQVIDDKQFGVLRYADRYKLQSLSTQAPAADRFTLPSQPLSVPDFNLQGIFGK